MPSKRGTPQGATPAKAADPQDPEAVTKQSSTRLAKAEKEEVAVVRGTVSYASRTPAAGLTVAAFDRDIGGEDALGRTATAADGSYRIEYTEAQFRRSAAEERGADIFVRIHAENGELLRESQTVMNAPTDLVLNVEVPERSFVVRGEVRFLDGMVATGLPVRAHDRDLRRSEPLGEAVKTDEHGQYLIHYAQGDFARAEKDRADLQITVQVSGRDPFESGVLFNAPPDAVFDVTLPWPGHDLSEFERVLRAVVPLLHGQGEQGDDLALFALEAADIAFLAQDTGIAWEQIDCLVRAYRNARGWVAAPSRPVKSRAAKPETAATPIPPEAFYAWCRLGLPREVTQLFALPSERLKATLREALLQRIIPASIGGLLDEIAELLQQIGRELALRTPVPGTGAPLGELLATSPVPLNPKQQAALASVVNSLRVSDRELPERIAGIAGFEGDPVPVARTLWLGTLARGYLPLVGALQRWEGPSRTRRKKKTENPRDLTVQERYALDLRRFAALTLDDLAKVMDAVGIPAGFPGNSEAEQREHFADSILDFVQTALPTAVLANRLSGDTADGNPFVETRSDLTIFFENNPGFELGLIPLELYLADQPTKKLEGVRDVDSLIKGLKDLSRISRVAPRYELIRPLIAAGLHSAFRIVQFTEREFIERYAGRLGGADQAAETYRRAEQAHGTALNVYMKYGAGFNSPSPYVIRGSEIESLAGTVRGGDGPREYAMTHMPASSHIPASNSAAAVRAQWTALFGSLDLCDCGDCRSLYSPAAYFVDVLRFLTRPQALHYSPLEVLLNRRPDLQHILLSCPNSTTPLPYIDLVNEILETAIVPRTFNLPEPTNVQSVFDDLNNSRLPAAFAPPFALAGYPLTGKASVRSEGIGGIAGQDWSILDMAWVFSLEHLGTNEGFLVSAWPQTSWTKEELRANPEHTHPPAYEVLREAVYPWTLPFNLAVEEGRGYLRHLGVPRHEVMETFFRDPATPLPGRTLAERRLVDQALAREYLGLTGQEADITTGRTTRDSRAVTSGGNDRPWDFWGLAESGNNLPNPSSAAAPNIAGTWVEVLRHVPALLQQSGLTYRELLELLGMYFINPVANGTRQLTIEAVETGSDGTPVNPATCRLDLLRIDGTDANVAAAFQRIARFVRLWRKLGWTARELDQAISAFAPPSTQAGFEELLLQLSHVRRLQAEFDLPVPALLSWWSEMDTAVYLDHVADEPTGASSLYRQVFRNRTVLDPIDAAFTETGTGLTGSIGDHLPTLAAALKVSAQDLARLRADLPDDALNLANLSRLYRTASLAGALELGIEEYQAIRRLTGVDPFGPVAATATAPRIPGTGATLAFVEKVRAIRGSQFSIEELEYLLLHRIRPESTVAPSEPATAGLLAELRRGLQAIVSENNTAAIPIDPAGDLTRNKLALLNWDASLIEELVSTLNGAVTYEVVLDRLSPPPSLPNADGSYAVAIGSQAANFTVPTQLDGTVSVEPRFLFLFSSDTAIETPAGWVVSAALRQVFGQKQINLAADAPVRVKVPEGSWTVANRYLLTRNGDVFSVHDQNSLQLRSTRLLSRAERELLRGTSTRAGFVTATTNLFQLQDQLEGRITYEPITVDGQPKARLRFTGPMTNARKARLDAVSTAAGYRSAIATLYAAPRKFIARYARSFSVPRFSAPLGAMPAVAIPATLRNRLYHEGSGATGRLHFVAVMTEPLRDTLLALSTDADYRGAVTSLYNQAEPGAVGGWVPALVDIFLTAPTPGATASAEDTTRLFDGPVIPASRFQLVLDKLLPYLHRALSERLVVQTIADGLGVETKAAAQLLTRWVKAPGRPSENIITEFFTLRFAQSNEAVAITRAAFPDQFAAFTLLHKISLLIGRLGITAAQLDPISANGRTGGWLELNALPVAPVAATTSSAAGFDGWRRLADLLQVSRALPFGELGMFELFEIARAVQSSTDSAVRGRAKKVWVERLATFASWPVADLEALLGDRTNAQAKGALGVTFPDDYVDERLLLRLVGCFLQLRRLGASATLAGAWGKANPTAAEEVANAASIKSAAKAKYTNQQWLEVAKPLRDPLRTKQRSALVAYLTTHPDLATGRRWRDADELYRHFLVDVQMEPCMTSSRIVQATNTVQLFIQRSLMTLEPDVFLSPDDVREWTQWRKQYRLWEANRKVLFYPENWIEPDLRDDKSLFFEELESELQQNDLTEDTAEDALLHYLEKLDQVGRLEITGVHRQQEAADPARKLDAIDVLHVFGRTRAVPYIHFYRRLEKGLWSPWEKVEMDIEGDHLVPIVWNRRLHLFWPMFSEKTDRPTSAERTANIEPSRHWEIKIAWSEKRNGGWTPRRVTRDFLRQDQHLHPLLANSPMNARQEPRDISFRVEVSGGRLKLRGYGGRVVERELSSESVSTPTPFPTTTQLLTVVAPHRDAFGGAIGTALKVRFRLNGAPPPPAERAKIRLGVRSADGQVSGTVSLNSLGVANLGSFTSPTVFLDLISEGYRAISTTEARSWWMPFNPVDYFNAVVESIEETVADALANAQLTQDAATAFDNALRIAVALVVASGGAAIPVAILAITTAAGIAGAGIAGALVDILGRMHGRRLIVTLEALPTPPPTVETFTTFQETLERMMPIGDFVMDDCNGDLVRSAELTQPGQLEPLPGTRIENMKFAEFGTGDQAMSFGTDERGASIQLFQATPGRFSLVAPPQGTRFEAVGSRVFFQDQNRTYFVTLDESGVNFATHYHPSIRNLVQTLKREGIAGLLHLSMQLQSDMGAAFYGNYLPVPLYTPPQQLIPREEIDFAAKGAYSLYNWELFFHIPFFIAMQLSRNQRFSEAQKWFHYVFDPTATDSPERPFMPGPERFWRVQPFYDAALRPVQTLEALVGEAGGIDEQVAVWQDNPFRPHVIARMRPVAYMKAVVMRYLDNVIAWGDQLFRQDTIESINEATHLYVLAAEILGKRPPDIPSRAKPHLQTFRTLDDRQDLNSLSNAVVEIESFLPPSTAPGSANGTQGGSLMMPFFCITPNDKLLGYWDTVADRLFKIRHCLNIEGVERTLPLFQPPIDPALLVRATAAGVDIASVLNDLNAAVPHYRFGPMMQKATELCNDVMALGSALLSALEKKDAEELSLLRSTHEQELLKAMRAIKEQQVKEAAHNLANLQKFEDVVTARQQYYLGRPFLNQFEALHLNLVGASLLPIGMQAAAEGLAAIMHLIPNTKVGAPTTMGVTYGGANIASAIQSSAGAAGATASILGTTGSLSATLGGYQRRQDDWTHQADLASRELRQVKEQLAAAELRLAIAEHELSNHDLQTENATEIDDYLRSRKFSNRELYGWMVGKLSGLYFQGYQLAYEVAKRTERTFRYELGIRDSTFIQFGYWDSLKKGLLSGERLHHDLKRMDVAYLDQNRREFEITKHISLNAIDPVALLELKEKGECFVSLPEALFDLDYPGHILRRIKSVSVSIPCVTGPYAGVNCTLTLHSSSIRHAGSLLAGRYARKADDSRFSDSFGTIESIVTSGGQNDTGLFETNLRDERYLPFEGRGAVGTWRIQLPTQFKSFDYNTISDVILHVRYTAREGGELLRQHASAELATAVDQMVKAGGRQGMARAFSLRHEFPTAWHRFLNPPPGNADQTMLVDLGRERFPLLVQDRIRTIDSVELFVKVKPEYTQSHNASTLELSFEPGAASATTVLPVVEIDGLVRAETAGGPLGTWSLTAWLNGTPHLRLGREAIQDIVLVCRFSCS